MEEIKPDGVIHVKIDEAVMKREDLLTCAKGTIQLLKEYQEFKKLRKEREKTQEKFLSLTKEIVKLIRKLKARQLPKLPIEEKIPKEKKKPVKIIKKVKKEEVKREPTVTEELDKELQDIQDKISTLEI